MSKLVISDSWDDTVTQGDTLALPIQVFDPRYVFKALDAGTSDASTPTWPTALDSTVVDNDITWLNICPADEDDLNDYDPWIASRKYSARSLVLSTLSPWDLTGYTANCELRTEPGGTLIDTAAIAFDADRTTGKLTATFSAAMTALWTFTTPAYYDIEVTSAGSVVTTVLRGALTLRVDVTD